MKLETHGPSLAAIERLVKARATGDAGAIHKGEISLIDALRSYVQATSTFNADGKDEAVIRLAAVILSALAASDFSTQFQSGSPAGNPVNLRVRKELAEPFGDDLNTLGVGAAIMRKAKAGLNQWAVYTQDTAQDVSEFDHYQSHGSKVQKAAGKRAPTSLSDVTGDPIDRTMASKPLGGL